MATWALFFVALACLVGVVHSSAGDVDPEYSPLPASICLNPFTGLHHRTCLCRKVHQQVIVWFTPQGLAQQDEPSSVTWKRNLLRRCIGECERSGCVGSTCFKHCRLVSTGGAVDGPWYMQEPLYLKWKKWDCQRDCGYYCMQEREKERHKAGQGPVKYHDKWPFKCMFGLQEPVSVALSALTLATHFHGWLSFFVLLYYKLPLRPDSKQTYYEYSGFWHIYGLLAMNSWFWSAVSHSRYCDLTQKLDYSSAIAWLGYSLILAIIASFNVVNTAARVMVAAPFITFVTSHILYLNLYKLDLGLNSKVIAVTSVVQLIMWAVWAGVHRHPSRIKLWVVVVGSIFAMILDMYDFPPYKGYVDAHALWHATAVPLGYIWWSFVRDDAELRTSKLVRKDE